MNYITAIGTSAGTAVTKEAGSIAEMLPKFGIIAVVVAIIIVGMLIYSKHDKKNK